jgi:hypothetical protein
MVHALKEAWRVLAPLGIMMDIRPLSIDTPLELIIGEVRELAGIVDMSPDLKYDILADQAIETVNKEGIFIEKQVDYFDYVYYWKTFHGMMADFEERWKDEIIIPEEVINKAQQLYKESRPTGMLRLGMRMKSGKYEKREHHPT